MQQQQQQQQAAESPVAASPAPSVSLSDGLSLPVDATPWDPQRSGTPHTNANSPIHGATMLADGSRASSNASDQPLHGIASGGGAAAAISGGGLNMASTFIPRPNALPILSLPALPGQRVCACMQSVVEATSAPAVVPTSPGTVFVAPATPGSSPPADIPAAAAAAAAGSLERMLALQDRFWLTVGEVAPHTAQPDDCAVEHGVDSMEALAVKLGYIAQQLTQSLRILRDEQLTGVLGVMAELENKNGELVEFLRQTRGEEMIVRERIDQLTSAVEKAKKTVRMGANLGLASAKQAREAAHLESVRGSRDAALRQLERVVAQRTLAQNQMLNVGTLAAECRQQDMDRRNYKLMYKQIDTPFFHRSFGAEYQQQMFTLVKVLSRLRDTSHECARRKRLVEHTISELRARISLVVAAYWR